MPLFCPECSVLLKELPCSNFSLQHKQRYTHTGLLAALPELRNAQRSRWQAPLLWPTAQGKQHCSAHCPGPSKYLSCKKCLVLYTPLLLVMSSTDFLFPLTPEKTVHTNPSSSPQEPLLARLPTHKHKDSVLKRAQSFSFWIHSSGLQGILLYVLHSNMQ